VTIKLMAWTQDANGADVYTDSGDLVYFPRQMDVEPGQKRLVRLGAKAPASGAERTYRLFIEEVPSPSSANRSQVTFYFRFGVPVFVPPPAGKPQPEVLQPTLNKGKFALPVENRGTVHFRPKRVVVSDEAGWSREITSWYSLAGSSRKYETDIPAEVCRKARALAVRVETEGANFDRKLDVDPASCS
jgi:fimbrial chaperone protein